MGWIDNSGVITETVTLTDGYPGKPPMVVTSGFVYREEYAPSAQGLTARQRRELREAGWYYRDRRGQDGRRYRGWWK